MKVIITNVTINTTIINVTPNSIEYAVVVLEKLKQDVAAWGLQYEFEQFCQENRNLDIFELDKQFRNEWDL